MIGPRDHPLRYALSEEFHARPFAELAGPVLATHFALLPSNADARDDRDHVADLCRRFDRKPPAADANHFLQDFGAFRLKWERHTEFTTFSFFHQGASSTPFDTPAFHYLPADWIDSLPGERLVATNLYLGRLEDLETAPGGPVAQFQSKSLCRGQVMAGRAEVWTDFRIHDDGFTRILIVDRGLVPSQAGRLVQQVLELQTYRSMALLALPLAREAGPVITRIDQSLAELTAEMQRSSGTSGEKALLDKLMALSTEIEASIAATSYRFSAAAAYHALVRERLSELDETLVEDFPTLRTFIERRLAPAMRTCESVAERQTILSERATRAANLLRTSVDIALEAQNSALLASMDKRAKLQLRLQQTVEGLSVAAITYYLVSLIGYLLKALSKSVPSLNVDLLRGLCIPLVAILVWLAARSVRKSLHKDDA
ncbi:MAG TPA: DUF3422 domain-containing protein [Kiloniellaceae bacterium]|nr:DUF3422 domain-containing protein [Kiloniellaceae bacterium]